MLSPLLPLSHWLVSRTRSAINSNVVANFPRNQSASLLVAARDISCQGAYRAARAWTIAMRFAQIIIDQRVLGDRRSAEAAAFTWRFRIASADISVAEQLVNEGAGALVDTAVDDAGALLRHICLMPLKARRMAHGDWAYTVASNAPHWASMDTASSGTRIVSERSQDACNTRAPSSLPPVVAAAL